MRKAKKLIMAAACLLLICVVGIRVYFVNESAPKIEVEHYGMGEWVDLNGAFLDKISENTKGYSLRVTNASLMSYNEYINQFGSDKMAVIEGLDAKSIVCLQMEFKNEGNEDGSINIFQCKLIPSRKNSYFMYARNLWAENEPSIENALAFRLAKDSAYTSNIPYKINKNDKENHTEYKKPITDTSFELIVSNAPVRKVIDINI